MSAVKGYFKEQTQLRKLGFEHNKPSDFYLSAGQRTRSSVPLLIFRTCLFISAVSIVIWSMVYYIQARMFGYWFIYLTNWGLIGIVLATGFAAAVSTRCYLYGPLSAEFYLPWYVKIYWVFYNVSIPMAFLITIFYWTVLYEAGIEEEMTFSLDLAIHGLNSVLMFLLLISSRVPSRLLHFHHSVILATAYVFFNLIYYLAGGTNPRGQRWIYPVLDWSNPGPTIGVAVGTGALLVCMHFITIGLALVRDAVTSCLLRTPVIVHDEGVPLREQTQQPTQTELTQA